ncbi:MAG TPA: pyridoxamine 5'-phosphate oxidase family protein [Rhodocyclaceae bacterium]|nr:pyridoxamine 5'-phosphate oxidase family protein [Rhodocyclaceae bacterium]
MKLQEHEAQSAWHAGERALQQVVGVAERMAPVGQQVIRDYMPQQHREFFPQLPFLVVGSVDAAGQPTASILAAPPGFISSPDERTLHIAVQPQPDDPLAANLHVGASLGALGIEPHTRRRNRANGRVSSIDARGITLTVQQSFGNCPKYIQAREPAFDAARTPGAARISTGLDAATTRLIKRADTFFIASAHPDAAQGNDARAHGVDVSHRGGKPGFVRVDGDVLTVPDFRGNFFFNTLGNLVVHPQAGLLFVDFDSGDLLQLDVHAEVITQGDALEDFVGAERLMRLRVTRVLWRPAALALRWGEAAYSPSLAGLGAWPAAR